MRKALTLFTALFLVLICLFSTVFVTVNAQKDKVTVTESYIYGDKSLAEGVTVHFDSKYENNLQWLTDYTIGKEPKAETEFRFYRMGMPSKDTVHRDISIYTAFNYSTTSTDEIDLAGSGITKAYRELEETAEPYKEAKKRIMLTDYYEYYPLEIDISFSDKYYLNSNVWADSHSAYDKAVIKKFNSFFKIPIVKGSALDISIYLDNNRNVIQRSSAEADTGNNFGMYVKNVNTDSKSFFTFINRTESGKIADTSLIDGGYGVYCLPFSETENSVIFEFDNFKNVFPVNEENEIYEMSLNDNNTELYIMTKEDKNSVLTIIDTQTYKEKERITVSEGKNRYSFIYQISDSFILFSSYDEKEGQDYYTVISRDKDGRLKKEMTVPVVINANTDSQIGSYYNSTFATAQWDGEKLYICNELQDYITDETKMINCGFMFSVYDRKALRFYGEYSTSLTTGGDGTYWSNYHIHNNSSFPITFTLPE